MEPVSFALAIGAIPGIFTSCVDCFVYVQLGKHFGEDYGLCLAQLEAAEMRLLRWGEPMGFLSRDFNADDLFPKAEWKAEEIDKAKRWLGLILTQFEKAKNDSKEYEEVFAKSKEDTQIPDEAVALQESGDSVKQLVAFTRKVTKRRQKHLSLGGKIRWALYRKSDFESLIEKICRLISNLIELFPALQERQKELCLEEVKELPKESYPDLIKVLKDDDKLMNIAIAEEIKTQGHQFSNVVFDGDGAAHLGDNHAMGSNREAKSMAFTGMRIGGKGNFHAGHNFGGTGEEPQNKNKTL